jgi:hypothetical protein
MGNSINDDFGKSAGPGLGALLTSSGAKGLKDTNAPVVDKERLENYDDAMRKIKDATGVSDVNEIIQKFAT